MIDRRRLSRSVALQVLYELDSTHHDPDAVLAAYANIDVESSDARVLGYLSLYAYHSALDDDFAPTDQAFPLAQTDYQMVQRLVMGAVEHQVDLDALIARHAPEWPPDQIATVDRNILRIAIYEMVHNGLPVKVVINEAIEVAKIFGTESSPRFINGVLGAVAQEES
ncbi:MAG: transcription antitermination factor NusB [Chloroflexi bacterium]|nr:transcription antitermination factor NusB [Chloroflexota bacterium]